MSEWGFWAKFAGAIAVLLVLAWWGLSACERQADEDFQRQCETRHPGSHMSKSEQYAYKSVVITRYCIGPNGELWEVS